MRILALNYEFPPLGGGASNATAHICRELVRMGHQVEVVTSGYSGLPSTEEVWGFRVHRVPVIRTRVHQSSPFEMATFPIGAFLPTLRRIRSFKPDIMHAYFAIPTGVVSWLAKKFTSVPYLLSLRGGDVPGFLPETLGKFHELTAPITTAVWGNADAIVANSTGLRELAQQTARIPVALATNGIDLDAYHPPAGPRNDGVYRILFAGRLVEQKGLRYVIDALPGIIDQTGRKVELVVVGDGPSMPALELQAKLLGVGDAVRFLGWQPREAMPDLYRSADVFAFPSFEEGMPNVVLEAMASGLPIVTTNIYGNRELVTSGEQGYLLPTADAIALRFVLVGLAEDDEQRTAMSRAARERAAEYGWNRTAARYVDLSEYVLGTLRSKRPATV